MTITLAGRNKAVKEAQPSVMGIQGRKVAYGCEVQGRSGGFGDVDIVRAGNERSESASDLVTSSLKECIV